MKGNRPWPRGNVTRFALAHDGLDRAWKRRCSGQSLDSQHRGLALVLAPTSVAPGLGTSLFPPHRNRKYWNHE
jgi:hypothetical protein